MVCARSFLTSSLSLCLARLILVTAVLLPVAVAPAVASAADDGTISGTVINSKTNEGVKDAIVVLQCTCLQGSRETRTNAQGLYIFRELPPGTYTVQVLFGQADVSKVTELPLGAKFRANFSIDPANEFKRRIVVQAAPVKPQTSVTTSVSMEQARNIPVGGANRDFTQVVEMSPTATRDSAGISLAGTSGAESKYTVDGANVNNPSFGTVGATIVQEFIDTVEVTESGYDAEFGGASGGQVSARRISGANKVRGVARYTYTPRLAAPRFIQQTDESIRVVQVPDYAMQGVVVASGPIVKDKLFWSAGIVSGGSKYSLIQSFYHRLDKDESGGFEDCPYENGANDCVDGEKYIATERFARQTFPTRALNIGFVVGLDWAINPKHRVELTTLGGPGFARRAYRLPLDVNQLDLNAFGTNPVADPQGGGINAGAGVVNDHFGWDRSNQITVNANYLGRVADDKMEIDAGVSYSQFLSQEAWKLDNSAYKNLPATQESDTQGANLFELLDRDEGLALAPGVEEACNDPEIPGLVCPTRRWLSGGIGQYGRDRAHRVEGRIALTHFFNGWGSHQLKYGAQVDHQQRSLVTQYSGSNSDDFYDNCPEGQVGGGEWCYDPETDSYDISFVPRVNNHRFITVDTDDPNQRFTRGFGRVRREQDELRAMTNSLAQGSRVDAYEAVLTSQNYGIYLQDKWAVLSNLYLNAGVRWEIQDMQDVLGRRALLLWQNVAPRLGVVYDWTDEGKSRLYASYGWFYQPLPLQLASRVFGGLVHIQRQYKQADCLGRTVEFEGDVYPLQEDGQPTEFCRDTALRGGTSGLFEGAVTPNLKGMYRQQFQVGYQQEIIEDLLLRVSWLHTDLGRTVEDVSTDGGTNYLIANPGEQIPQSEIDSKLAQCEAIQDEIDSTPVDAQGFPALVRERQRCQFLANAYQTLNDEFPKPTQNFDAFTFEVQKRFAKNWLLMASYTYSRLVGNYRGFVDPNTGAVAIGADRQYDIPDLVRNSFGPLPFDQRHRLRINGFYSFDLREAGRLTLGTSFNVQSGYPVSLMVATTRFAGERPVHVLPRGSAGRVEPNYQWNLSLGYAYPLPGDLEIEFSSRLLNVTNAKAVLRVDEVYSFQAARPIAGGDLSDLKHAKWVNPGNPGDFFDREVIDPQGNFSVERQFQNPLAAQFDLQLRF